MADDETSTGDTCQKCSREETEWNPLIEVRIPLTGEYWMLCDPCIDEVKRYIEARTHQEADDG